MQIHETTLFLKFPLSLIDLLLFTTNSVTLSLQPARFLKKKSLSFQMWGWFTLIHARGMEMRGRDGVMGKERQV